MKRRIRVGDQVEIVEGHYWPDSKFGRVIRKDPILSGRVVVSHWYVVLQEGATSPRLMTRSQIEKAPST